MVRLEDPPPSTERRTGPAADVPHQSDKRRSGLYRWVLMSAAVALLFVGLIYGDPTGPRENQPPLGVSPIVRRTINDARTNPRLTIPTPSIRALATGTLLEETVESAILGRSMPVGIYLPPGYESNERRYPVLYALHGAAGYYAEWVDFGVSDIADVMFSNSMAPPFIIVFPQGDQSYWFNHPQGGDAWADYVTEDVIPFIDTNYRTIPRRNGRAVGGLSMGAVGALQFGLRRPDLFSVVGAHSPSFRNTADNELFWYFADSQNYAQYDPYALVRTTNSVARLKIWIDVGDQDPWKPRTEEFHNLLVDREIAHRWSIGSGIHEGTYWGARMEDYLSFYAFALVQATGSGQPPPDPPVSPAVPRQVSTPIPGEDLDEAD